MIDPDELKAYAQQFCQQEQLAAQDWGGRYLQ